MEGGLSTHQRFALIFETETAASLLYGGLRALAGRSASNDELHLPLQLLSQGVERLLKLTWALGTWQRTEQLPSLGEVKDIGHDLVSLDAAVLGLGRSCDEFHGRSLITQEASFVADDPVLRAMLDALSNFARGARYRDLDLLLESKRAAETPDVRRQWSELESQVLALHPEWMARLADPSFTQWYEVLSGELLTRLQRYLRFVCFMWTLGPLGTVGRQYSVPLSYFIHLREDQFGKPPGTP